MRSAPTRGAAARAGRLSPAAAGASRFEREAARHAANEVGARDHADQSTVPVDHQARPPLVLKPRFGSWGREVALCEDEAALDAWLRAVRDRSWFRRHGAVAQEVIPPVGHDLRVVVAGGQAVAAAERVAAPGEWRTNISLGGSLRPTELTPATVGLARRAAAAIGADLVGVDLMPAGDGDHVVVELNGAVEFDRRYALRSRDVYAEIACALGLLTTATEGEPAAVEAARS